MKKELKALFKKYKWIMLLEAVLVMASAYFYTCPPKYLGIITDLLYNMDDNKEMIINSIKLLLASCIGIILTRLIWKNIEVSTELGMRKILIDHLFKKFLKVKLEDINATKNGEIMSYFVRDVKKVTKQIGRFYLSGIRFIFNFVLVGIMLAKNSNPILAISAIIPLVITIIALTLIRRRLRENFFLSQKTFTEFSEFVQESTDSIRTTKAFSGEKQELEYFTERNKKLKKYNLKTSYMGSLLDVLTNVGLGISNVIALLWGSNLVVAGQMTVGNLVAFLGYLTLLDMPVMALPWMISRIDEFKISLTRLNKVFNLDEEQIDEEEHVNKEHLSNIEIKDLSFHYPDSLVNVLSNINVSVKKGEMLGIIGVVGSGKTTLMNLLLKLYEVDPGKIFIDGKDINEINPKTIRDSICYITQDNFLFSTSLKENINLFKDEFNDESIIESTKQAMIHDEILDMEDGIYTVIGEKGIDLSGGQKQRVVLSRAFLNNSDIVIFDDTFSALDNKTEQHVLKNIKELVKDKTCIIVSNRISDIKDCDKIIVLEQGKIIEHGNHKSLINQGGKYYKFYNNQANKVEELA